MHIKYGDPCQRRFRELAVHSCWFLGAVHHVGRDCCVVLDQRLRYVFGVQMNKRKHEITGIGLSILLCKNKNPVAKVFWGGYDVAYCTFPDTLGSLEGHAPIPILINAPPNTKSCIRPCQVGHSRPMRRLPRRRR